MSSPGQYDDIHSKYCISNLTVMPIDILFISDPINIALSECPVWIVLVIVIISVQNIVNLTLWLCL